MIEITATKNSSARPPHKRSKSGHKHLPVPESIPQNDGMHSDATIPPAGSSSCRKHNVSLSRGKYLLFLGAKGYHLGFLVGHVLFLVLWMSLLMYSIVSTPVLDGFTIVMLVSNIIHVGVLYLGLASWGNTELLLQLFAIALGLGTIIQCLVAIWYTVGFTATIAGWYSQKQKDALPYSLLSLYDILNTEVLYPLLLLAQWADFAGLVCCIVAVHLEIRWMYHAKPAKWILCGDKNVDKEQLADLLLHTQADGVDNDEVVISSNGVAHHETSDFAEHMANLRDQEQRS